MLRLAFHINSPSTSRLVCSYTCKCLTTPLLLFHRAIIFLMHNLYPYFLLTFRLFLLYNSLERSIDEFKPNLSFNSELSIFSSLFLELKFAFSIPNLFVLAAPSLFLSFYMELEETYQMYLSLVFLST